MSEFEMTFDQMCNLAQARLNNADELYVAGFRLAFLGLAKMEEAGRERELASLDTELRDGLERFDAMKKANGHAKGTTGLGAL